MKPLTRRQSEILSFIKEFVQENRYPPTIREIGERFRISSPRGVIRHLDALEKKGYIEREGGISRGIRLVENKDIVSRVVPIVGRVTAGYPSLALETIEGYLSLDPAIARWNDLFLLRVQGDSMIEAHILPGDLVLIKPQPIPENGSIVVVIIDDDATLKRFFQDDEGILLKPANRMMQPIYIQRGEVDTVRIVGKVVAVIRALEMNGTENG